jgi:hypothetical protein
VDAHGAGYGADGSRAYAVFLGGGDGGFFKPGVVAEAEIVVGGKVDNALAVIGANGGLLVVQFAEFEEGATLTEIVELGGKVGELAAFRGCGGHGNNRKPLRAG